MAGEVGILNVAAGDTKLSFDPSNSEEVERAKRVLTDMLRRGYAILIEIGRDDKGPMYRRALGFDPETAEYIIAGTPDIEEEPANVQSASPPPRRTRSRQGATARVLAASTNAVAVARTSGG